VSYFNNDLNAWWKAIVSNQSQAWLTMHSGSMYPLMPTGSQILVKAVECSSIRVGDIVLYVDQNQLIAHRVFKLNLTQNQCLQGGDNVLAMSVISLDNIIGVVEKIKVNGKEINLTSRTGRLLTRFMIISRSGVMALRQRWPKMGYLLHRLLLRVVRVVFT
jgi:signal peptidase I